MGPSHHTPLELPGILRNAADDHALWATPSGTAAVVRGLAHVADVAAGEHAEVLEANERQNQLLADATFRATVWKDQAKLLRSRAAMLLDQNIALLERCTELEQALREAEEERDQLRECVEPEPGLRCADCGASCDEGRNWMGGDLAYCPACADQRVATREQMRLELRQAGWEGSGGLWTNPTNTRTMSLDLAYSEMKEAAAPTQ